MWSGDQQRYVSSRSRSRPGYLRLNVSTIEQYRAHCSNGTDTAFHRTYSYYRSHSCKKSISHKRLTGAIFDSKLDYERTEQLWFCVCLQSLEAGPDGRCGHPAVIVVEEGPRFDAEPAKIHLIAWTQTMISALCRTVHAIHKLAQVCAVADNNGQHFSVLLQTGNFLNSMHIIWCIMCSTLFLRYVKGWKCNQRQFMLSLITLTACNIEC